MVPRSVLAFPAHSLYNKLGCARGLSGLGFRGRQFHAAAVRVRGQGLSYIPEAGSSFVYENLKITVTKVDEVMAHEIKVEVTQNEDAAQ